MSSQLSFILKALVVGFLMLLLMIPLAMIRGTISERQSYRSQAIESVERSYAGKIKFAGPVLIVPYQDVETIITKNEKGVESRYEETSNSFWIFYPKTVDVSGLMVPSIKELGIHKVRIYELNAKMKAQFEFNTPDTGNPLIKRTLGSPYLSFLMNDTRGLMGTPKLSIAGETKVIKQGAGSHGLAAQSKGVHVVLPIFALAQAQKISVDMDFLLGGTETLSLIPIADSNKASIQSTWPHPNFSGDFSPRNSDVTDKGFKANWNISSLSASAQTQYRNKTELDQMDSFEVNLIDPVNIYTQADRASKYAFLFIVLTFVGFLMFEIIKQLAIHPIQYGLVGLSLAIFFCLLLSLSEHMDFWKAYLIASVACIGLLGVYVKSVLKSTTRSLGFSAMLTVLYSVLYGLLISEDNALVMGSILLFSILAAVMLVTRN
ncbi:MAG: cell envelope integrity protein CreD, partial [Arenimonas sp.]